MKRIFFIYTEATIACMLGAACILELLCGFAMPEGLSVFAYGASVLFLLGAVHQVRYIVKAEGAHHE